MLTRIVIRKERKYNLIRPFWLVIVVDIFIWVSEMVFGKMGGEGVFSPKLGKALTESSLATW